MADKLEKIVVPDIGSAKGVSVVEIQVKPGDKVAIDTSIITLEGDKAAIDVPAPMAGEVAEVKLKVGDKVSEGDVILLLKAALGAAESKPQTVAEKQQLAAAAMSKVAEKTPEKPSEKSAEKSPTPTETSEEDDEGDLHAGPGVRRIAHEFGVDLQDINGSGPKGRILKEDLQQYVRQKINMSGGGAGLGVAPLPKIDFSKFGEISQQPLSKIKKSTGVNLHRNWVTIPHVTQFDEADITDLEEFRKKHQAEAVKLGFKLTPIVFIMKAVVSALKKFPAFNSSLDENNENLILKKYYHLGVAVDTPNGLVVPVIRDVDKKNLLALAKELHEISTKAREKGLSLTDMQGGTFSISSLGGIGGTAFTPIINAPEVAILGVSKSALKLMPQEDGEFDPRLMLPLSLSYDHRVIDGAEAARFITYLSQALVDMRTILL